MLQYKGDHVGVWFDEVDEDIHARPAVAVTGAQARRDLAWNKGMALP